MAKMIDRVPKERLGTSVLNDIFLRIYLYDPVNCHLNCENLIIGCTVGFWAILYQSLAFTTLDENWIVHAIYLSACSCDTMSCVWERKSSKLELFIPLFINFLCQIVLARAEIPVSGEFQTIAVWKWFNSILVLWVFC